MPDLCRSYAKGFGAVGALYAGSECVIEKVLIPSDPDFHRMRAYRCWTLW